MFSDFVNDDHCNLCIYLFMIIVVIYVYIYLLHTEASLIPIIPLAKIYSFIRFFFANRILSELVFVFLDEIF